MRKIAVMTLAAWGAAAFGGWGQVITSFPAPGSNAGGLTWDGGYLWYADYGSGSSAPSTIYKMTTTGSYAGQWVVPWPYAMGLAWDGAYIWCDSLTVRYVYKLNPANCSVLGSFYGPSAHMMGMESDGSSLYINDWSDVRVAKVSFTGSLQQLIPVSGPSPSGVALQGQYLWYTTRNYWYPDQALCIKAVLTSGSTVNSFQSPDSQATDLAFDGTYLWVSGYTNKYIYKVDVTDNTAITPTSLGKVKALFR